MTVITWWQGPAGWAAAALAALGYGWILACLQDAFAEWMGRLDVR